MIFKPNENINKAIIDNKLCVCIGNNNIARTKSVKYLGIIIDEKLNFADHITMLTKKIKSLSGMLYHKKYFFSQQCRKNIYFFLIYSSIIYGIEIYRNTTKHILNPLIIRCNYLLRLLHNKPLNYNVRQYVNYNSQPVDLFFKLYIVKVMHRFVYDSNSLPVAINLLIATKMYIIITLEINMTLTFERVLVPEA